MEVHARATAAHDVAASGLPSRLVPGLPSCSPLAPFRDFCLKCLYEATLGHSRFQQARFAVDARSNHRSLRTKCERHQCAPHPTIWQGNSCFAGSQPTRALPSKKKTTTEHFTVLLHEQQADLESPRSLRSNGHRLFAPTSNRYRPYLSSKRGHHGFDHSWRRSSRPRANCRQRVRTWFGTHLATSDILPLLSLLTSTISSPLRSTTTSPLGEGDRSRTRSTLTISPPIPPLSCLRSRRISFLSLSSRRISSLISRSLRFGFLSTTNASGPTCTELDSSNPSSSVMILVFSMTVSRSLWSE